MGQVPAASRLVCVKLKVYMTENFLFARSIFFLCAEKENCTDKSMNGIVEYSE